MAASALPAGFFRDLAEQGIRFPIATDLVLQEEESPEEILLDGAGMAEVIEKAARRYGSPLALPIMDLTTEKNDLLLSWFGVKPEDCGQWHFDSAPSDSVVAEVERGESSLTPRLAANVGAIAAASAKGALVPVGMTIGPFSLMTKLIASPIEPIYMMGMGMGPDDEDDIALVVQVMRLSMAVIMKSLRAQVAAGAKVVFIAEPAANLAYVSPNQIEAGSTLFEDAVLQYNRKVVDYLHGQGVQVIFHCCGELITPMLKGFCSLGPEVLSLGSSRVLVDDAALVPKDIVLYGNIPSKKFYSDDLITVDQVTEMAREIASGMKQAGHPFILGSECDVLSVPGSEEQIRAKVAAILAA